MESLNRVRKAKDFRATFPQIDPNISFDCRLIVVERVGADNKARDERWELTLHASGRADESIPTLITNILNDDAG